MKTVQCGQCNKTFKIADLDQEFYNRIDVPEPKNCPQCRMMRRLVERNARSLYKRKCDFSGKEIISQFHSEQPFPVYEQKIWWSDKWDALDYGQDFDFNKPFFPQFQELLNKVPHMSVFIIGGTLENSDFTNCTGYLKNCYLLSEADYNENCYYSNRVFYNENLVDCSDVTKSELCYECVDCRNCYSSQYLQDCRDCTDCYFLYDCRGCKDCIGGINLRNQQYMIYNKQYSKEDYEKKKKELHLNTREGIEELKKQSKKFFETKIHQHLQVEKNENSFGDHLYNSKNAKFCFDCSELENCTYCMKIFEAKECMDHVAWGDKAELIYFCSSCGDNIYNLKFCSTCNTKLKNLEYCYLCSASSDLFGCAGLKKQNNCILNKKYNNKDYQDLRKKIIAHMKETGEYGEYFPKELCPFTYNESIAMDYFPLNKEEAIAQGYKWHEEEKQDVIDNALVCGDCGKNFKIIDQEKEFYERLDIPEPTKCYPCRHKARMKKRNPIDLWHRTCMKPGCDKEFETNYSPDRKELVYCEECYKKEIY